MAALAFSDPGRVEEAKVGILAGSLISGVIGFLVVRATTSTDPRDPPTVA